jgi:hypothetical protein
MYESTDTIDFSFFSIIMTSECLQGYLFVTTLITCYHPQLRPDVVHSVCSKKNQGEQSVMIHEKIK